MYPLISVIVPIYKAEPYLAQCLFSIAHQTYQNIEIILIDDGSPDRCGYICEQYALRDQRFRVLHQPNQGVSAARNKAMECACGDWLTFVDADDWLEANMLKQLQSSSCLQSGTDVVIGNTYKNYISAQTKLMPGSGTFVVHNRNVMLAAVLSGSGMDGADMRGPCGKLYYHQLIKENNIRFSDSLSYGEDMIFNLQVMNYAHKIIVDKSAYYHYRMNMESACRSFSPNTIERTDKLIQQCNAIIGNNQELHLPNQSGIVRLIMADCDCYFFHPNNLAPLKNRLAQLKKFLSCEPYATALGLKNNPYVTRKQRIFVYLAKRCWVKSLWLLYQCKGLLDRMRRKVSKSGAGNQQYATTCKE